MEIKYAVGILIYYSFLTLLFIGIQNAGITGGATISNQITDFNSTLAPSDIDSGGLLSFFNPVISVVNAIAKWFVFILIGIGLPIDTPTWLNAFWVCWTLIVNAVVGMVILNSFWGGNK